MEFKETEKKIKKILEERQIQPTDGLWEKLEGQMDAKPSFRWGIWLKYAAIAILLLGIVGLGSDMFFTDSSSSQSVVKTSIEVKKMEDNKNVLPKDDLSSDSSPDPRLATHSKAIRKVDKIRDSQPAVNPIKVENTDSKYDSFDKEEKPEPQNLTNRDSIRRTEIALRVSQLLLQEAEPRIAQTDYKDEADLLLEEAMQRESQPQVMDSTVFFAKVEDLLNEVTRELDREEDRNFRDKVYDFIKERWEKARTGLAEGLSK